MPQPTPYTRQQNFTTWQAANPGVWPTATDLDAEFNALKVTTDEVRRNMALLQNDNGGLQAGVVTSASLDGTVTGLLVQSNGTNPRGNWGAALAYAVKDLVVQSSLTYLCAAAHNSGTFATDLAAGYWIPVTSGTSAGSISFTPTGNVAATNVQAAIAEVDAEKQAIATSLTALSSLTPASDQLPYFSGASTAALTAFTAAGRTLVGGADAATQRGSLAAATGPASPTQYTLAYWDSGTRTLAAIGSLGTAGTVLTSNGAGAAPSWQAAASTSIPSGVMMAYGGTSAPSGWLLCDGSAVSRTTYSTLYAIVGTAFGVGDGSTTFNLPDLRGRVPVGKDNMGGSAASRMTTAGSGVDGLTLGASGGAQTHTLTTAQLASHSHSHSHTLTGIDGGGGAAGPLNNSGSSVGTYTTNTDATTAGSGQAHNNTQPSLITNYIIKT